MNDRKTFRLILFAAAVVTAGLVLQSCAQPKPEQSARPVNNTPTQSQPPSTTAPIQKADTRHVPAHYKAPPASTELRPVLAASQFMGKAREAYAAVKEIPATIAQMPCYCHCDRGMGHKSLHSCFEDDHAAHCAVCVDEALMAYRLQKEGLSAAEIRTRIIAKFAEPGM